MSSGGGSATAAWHASVHLRSRAVARAALLHTVHVARNTAEPTLVGAACSVQHTYTHASGPRAKRAYCYNKFQSIAGNIVTESQI